MSEFWLQNHTPLPLTTKATIVTGSDSKALYRNHRGTTKKRWCWQLKGLVVGSQTPQISGLKPCLHKGIQSLILGTIEACQALLGCLGSFEEAHYH